VRRGYEGLVEGTLRSLTARDVGGIIQHGGTVLGSARCPEFAMEETRRAAVDVLTRQAVDGLVVIGGNGSQTGAFALSQMGVPVVGVASTIDNDLYGSDITIGVDTALNIALEAIDRLKTTASSHQRAFLVEVMGRNCGYLALMAGLTGGAEVVVIPEAEMEPRAVADEFRKAY
jgi:6-phosphofructokinase 1